MATVMGAGSQSRLGRASSTSRSNNGRSHSWTHNSGRSPSPVPLDNLIQEQIIPRLLLAHSHTGPRQHADGMETVTAEDAANFASLPLELEADELLAVVEGFLARGVAVESIFVDLLAPSARKLGQYWEEDACDFLDVTMGLWRLQEVMREVATCYPSLLPPAEPPRSALFAPMPGDCHSFGGLMIEEVFARAGWQTDVLIESKRKELLQIVAERHFDLVGLTVSNDCPTGHLAEMILAIRSASRSSNIQVFIGGRMVNDNPGIVALVGADGTATDARSFLALAEVKIKGSGRLDLSVA